MAAVDDRITLLRRIQEMEFTGVELNLYLNTHPEDTQALQNFCRTANELATLKQQYEQVYGPLLGFGFGKNPGNNWVWALTPWPWEM